MYWSEALFAIGSRPMGERGFGLPAGFPSVPPDQFSLDGFEERFDGSSVVAIALAAHPRPASRRAGTPAGQRAAYVYRRERG